MGKNQFSHLNLCVWVLKCACIRVTEGGFRACSSTSWGEDKGSQLIGTVTNSFYDILGNFKQ